MATVDDVLHIIITTCGGYVLVVIALVILFLLGTYVFHRLKYYYTKLSTDRLKRSVINEEDSLL